MIHYETYGNKFNPIILCLHSESCVHIFAKQHELMKNYYLIVPHIPGFGQSYMEEFSVNTAVEQIAELANFFGKQMTLMGCSLGAQLCLPLMCRYEHLFNGCIMISPWLIKTADEIEKALKKVDSHEKIMKNNLAIGLNSFMMGLGKKEREEQTEYSRNVRLNNLAAAIDNGIELEKFPGYSGITKPMFAVCGIKDELEIRKTVRALSQKNTNCTYDMWDNVAGNIPLKCASRLNKVIEEFVDKANIKK